MKRHDSCPSLPPPTASVASPVPPAVAAPVPPAIVAPVPPAVAAAPFPPTIAAPVLPAVAAAAAPVLPAVAAAVPPAVAAAPFPPTIAAPILPAVAAAAAPVLPEVAAAVPPAVSAAPFPPTIAAPVLPAVAAAVPPAVAAPVLPVVALLEQLICRQNVPVPPILPIYSEDGLKTLRSRHVKRLDASFKEIEEIFPRIEALILEMNEIQTDILTLDAKIEEAGSVIEQVDVFRSHNAAEATIDQASASTSLVAGVPDLGDDA